MRQGWTHRWASVALGIVVGAGLATSWQAGIPEAAAQANRTPPPDLPADVAHLKDIVPSQSHSMLDVGTHWSSLWFAAQKKNWPLAQFYYDESRSHILWTIRIRPVRRLPDGTDVDIKSIYDAIDTSSMAAVKGAIEKKNTPVFVAAYKTMLESCYSCHKSSGKPYLRPMIPLTPGGPIINVDPAATWPQ